MQSAEGDSDRFEDAEEADEAGHHADGLPHSMRPEQ